jgi:hypothetical protein
MHSDFILGGSEELDPVADDNFARLYGDEVGYTVRHAVAITAVARGAATRVELTGEDDDVIEVEDVDDVVSFHRAASLVTQARQAGRGADLTGLISRVTRGDGGPRVAVVRRTAVSLPEDIVKPSGRSTRSSARTPRPGVPCGHHTG